MTALPPVERFVSSSGARIYRLPALAFADFVVYAYLVLESGPPTLIDTGSGFGDCTAHILSGIQTVRDTFGEVIAVTDIRRILISHGHIDHFGGLSALVEHTGAQEIGIHEIDRRVLTAYEERVIVATKDLRVYLERAGVDADRVQKLMEMYGFAKRHVKSVAVTHSLDEDAPLDGMTFIHTPGHCPGQVCILLGDVLLTADHILARTTPHQAPESITHYTGLGHYLESLRKVERVPGVRLALGGHEEPIHDLYGRVAAIRESHLRKLGRVQDALRAHGGPATISDISKAMYPDRHGYDVLLALEEVGAHVEYLYQHARLAVANLDELEREYNPALKYTLV